MCDPLTHQGRGRSDPTIKHPPLLRWGRAAFDDVSLWPADAPKGRTLAGIILVGGGLLCPRSDPNWQATEN